MGHPALLNLPTELLHSIAKDLPPRDLHSLILTSRTTSTIFTPLLHTLASHDKGGVPALIWAAHYGHHPLIKLLLSQKGPSILTTGTIPARPPPLSIPGSFYSEIPTPASDCGVAMPWRMRGGGALHFAARAGRLDTVRLLLDEGADVNARGLSRWNIMVSPLHEAAGWGHVGVVRALLESGADVEAGNCRSWEPVYLAKKGGYQDVVEVLLEYGASGRARGLTSFDLGC